MRIAINSNKYQLKTQLEKLNRLHDRISKIKIFDPACGSGNFLIIAYKELRNLEIEIIKKFNQLDGISSLIHLHNFYGIEIDDFAHEIAKLSLWLAEHQMNMKFKNEFGFCAPALPLKDSGNIVCANACRINWDEVCPKTTDDEIYVLGNPPYIGTRNQDKHHKVDMEMVFDGIKNYKNLDYIAAWFYKGSKYINGNNIKLAFVSTNSICQGDQVSLLWTLIFKINIEISFAYNSFKWLNNAKNNAGVTVVIIGLQNIENSNKILFTSDSNRLQVNQINAYLAPASNIIVSATNSSISKFPKMSYGNYTGGCNELLLTYMERDLLLQENPLSLEFIRPMIGSQEFIRGEKRFCIWINDNKLSKALEIKSIKNRIEKVRQNRLLSGDDSIQKLALKPYRFRDMNEAQNISIIVPIVSSERREYIPCGFLSKDVIIPNSAQAIYDPESWIFGVISSKMHMAWVRAVAGRLETRIRYSSTLCYNTFPFPNISEDQKKRIGMYAGEIIDEREKYSEKILAELYDPDKMPDGLRQAHHNLDIAIEQCYRLKPFVSDEERLEYLFTLYEQMTLNGSK